MKVETNKYEDFESLWKKNYQKVDLWRNNIQQQKFIQLVDY
jgi:hypothetical protein